MKLSREDAGRGVGQVGARYELTFVQQSVT